LNRFCIAFIQYIHRVTKRIMCIYVIKKVIKIHEISRFYYAFIISRFSLYSFFYIFFKFFNFLPILKYNFIVYLYTFSTIFFVTQYIAHKNYLPSKKIMAIHL